MESNFFGNLVSNSLVYSFVHIALFTGERKIGNLNFQTNICRSHFRLVLTRCGKPSARAKLVFQAIYLYSIRRSYLFIH